MVQQSVPKQLSFSVRQKLVPALFMAFADATGLLISWRVSAYVARDPLGGLPSVAAAGFLLALCLAIYLVSGLYPGMMIHPVNELKSLSIGTTLTLLVAVGTLFNTKSSGAQVRALLSVWIIALFTVPLSRTFLRRLSRGRPWWGAPTLILGSGNTGRRIANILRDNPHFGLKPVGILDDNPERYRQSGGQIPYLGAISMAASAARTHHVEHAIVAMPGVAAADLGKILSRHAQCFASIVVVPDLLGTANLWVRPRNIAGILGIEINQLSAQWLPQATKRLVDLILSSVGILLLSPLFLLLYAIIRLDSKGPAFYFQTRIGKSGARFKLWKFRSMHADCDRLLKHSLESDPLLASEWASAHKLRRDPRVTFVGALLRRLSLDELPQLWNVFKGDMSLVGPRPIVGAEIGRYRESFASYALVRPGITGLWQVSGRNNTSYEQRVQFDEYYVRNWSVWLDLYILARTIRIVLTCEGAY